MIPIHGNRSNYFSQHTHTQCFSEDHLEYAQKVSKIFELEGYYSEVDDSSDRIKKKVRNASNMAHNMILVVGKGGKKFE